MMRQMIMDNNSHNDDEDGGTVKWLMMPAVVFIQKMIQQLDMKEREGKMMVSQEERKKGGIVDCVDDKE